MIHDDGIVWTGAGILSPHRLQNTQKSCIRAGVKNAMPDYRRIKGKYFNNQLFPVANLVSLGRRGSSERSMSRVISSTMEELPSFMDAI